MNQYVKIQVEFKLLSFCSLLIHAYSFMWAHSMLQCWYLFKACILCDFEVFGFFLM